MYCAAAVLHACRCCAMDKLRIVYDFTHMFGERATFTRGSLRTPLLTPPRSILVAQRSLRCHIECVTTIHAQPLPRVPMSPSSHSFPWANSPPLQNCVSPSVCAQATYNRHSVQGAYVNRDASLFSARGVGEAARVPLCWCKMS
jgi:hypothetical protein